MEHRIDRRQFGRAMLGAAVVAGSMFGLAEPQARAYETDLAGEDDYHRFVNRQALECANACKEAQLDRSLAFDTSNPLKYKLYIPEVATAGRPNVPDGWYSQVIPMLASGEVPAQPPKPERPNWSRDVLLNPVFKGPSDRPMVALTIDDGYFNREEILQTIIKKDVTATFLIIGSIMDNDPEFIKRAQASGRITWGNHTYTHELLTAKSSAQIKGEYDRTEAALKRIAGATTIPFARPPGGAKNDTVISAGADGGLRTFLWNVSGDAGTQWSSNNPTALSNYYMGLIDAQKNPQGSIILMHFRNSTATSSVAGVPSALEQVIDGVRARGMEPVSLDRLYEGGRV